MKNKKSSSLISHPSSLSSFAEPAANKPSGPNKTGAAPAISSVAAVCDRRKHPAKDGDAHRAPLQGEDSDHGSDGALPSTGLIAIWNSPLAKIVEGIVAANAAAIHHQNLSGLSATLCGIFLHAAKQKVGHGNFKPWLAENFPDIVYETCRRFMAIGRAFMVNQKANRGLSFEGALLSINKGEQLSLNLDDPVVKKVAEFVKGRGSKELYEAIKQPIGHALHGLPRSYHPPAPPSAEGALRNANAIFRPLDELLCKAIAEGNKKKLAFLPMSTNDHDQPSLHGLLIAVDELRACLKAMIEIRKH